MKFTAKLKSYWIIIFIIFIWWIIAESEIYSTYLLPHPRKVLETSISMIKSGELLQHILTSIKRVFVGYIISFVLAFILGTLLSLKPRLYPYFSSIINFFRNVPPLALIPLLILWFGIGETTKFIMIILASFFPILLSIQKGLTTCDEQLIEVGKMMKFSTMEIFKKIQLPAAIPDILLGMRLGLGYSWRAIIAAEMIAAASGIGYMILFAQEMSRSDKVFIGIFTIGIIGILSDYLFGYLIDRIRRMK